MIIGLIAATLSWLMAGFIALDLLRAFSVPGTWRRYVYTSVQWALAAPALASTPFSLLFTDDTPLWAGLKMLNFVIVLVVLRSLMNDGDDNWWRQKRKQLKRYLESFAPQPALAGARS